MTKRDYEGVAYVLKNALARYRVEANDAGAAVVRRLARNLAEHFAVMNVKFKRDAFLKEALGEVGGPVND